MGYAHFSRFSFYSLMSIHGYLYHRILLQGFSISLMSVAKICIESWMKRVTISDYYCSLNLYLVSFKGKPFVSYLFLFNVIEGCFNSGTGR